jgi:hypothetical protein
MANEEQVNPGGISPEEIEIMAAEGLKKVRTYGGKQYGLLDVALKENQAKCDTLCQMFDAYRAEGIPVKREEKARVIALYGLLY